MDNTCRITPCLGWIKRGVAQEIPNKISLSKEQLKELLKESDTEENITLSNDNDENQVVKDRTDDLAKYALDSYDADDGQYSVLKGLACYPSNDVDPYMLQDETDDSDVEDFRIRSDDNLVCIGVTNKDSYSIQLFVYNENDDDFYIHHDIYLAASPLCMEWVGYDTEKSSLGNYLAVGSLSPVVEIWDVDIVDSLEPAFVLGCSKKRHKKRASSNGHTDAILSLAWNSYIQQLLVSGSADCTAAIWEMTRCEVLFSLKHFSEKVQSLKWHPFEPHYLLTGSCDEYVRLIDCREPDKVVKTWKCNGEVENVLWDHFNPFNCLASTEKGLVVCYDARGGENAIWTLSAHPEACSGLTISAHCPGLMVTSSFDGTVKIWDILDNKPSFVHEIKLPLGKLFCISSSPDSPFTLCVGGQHRSESFKLIDLMTYTSVRNRFECRELLVPTFKKREECQSSSEEPNASSESVQSKPLLSALNSHHKTEKGSRKKVKAIKEEDIVCT